VSQESPRIAQLRRRVHADPASIAFAQLAEEYRRAGDYQEAVKYCRTGLARHPSYLSARVTLGRSLTELGELDDAVREFDLVLRSAPDNLAAIRGIAEIHHRRGDMAPALEFYQRALALARFDPVLEESVNRLAREMREVSAAAYEGMSFEGARSQLLSAAGRLPEGAAGAPTQSEAGPRLSGPSPGSPLIDFDAVLASLGAPDAPPPPVTEMLLSGAPEMPALADPVGAALPAPASDDPFAALERTLQTLGGRSAAVQANEEIPPASVETSADEADDRAVQELEAWLRVLDGGPGSSQTV
jgi:tetratricopeptide (TPR) repeat protein